ncbi:hypothetical protein COM96_27625, partial [Bacillus cereus]
IRNLYALFTNIGCTSLFYSISTVYKKRRLTPTDIHLPPKIGVSHLHIFEEGVFCQKTIKVEV